MTSTFHAVDETLLLLAEARERAENAAREVRSAGGPEHVADALSRVDAELLALHRRLLDEAVLGGPAQSAPTQQLALDAA